MNSEDWMPHWKNLINKVDEIGYEKLSENERLWFNIRDLIDSADNGGLISFYYNSGADHLDETIEDLAKLNASEVIEILSKINKLFPNAKPPKDIDARNETISSWEDEVIDDLLEDLDNEFYELEEDLESRIEPIVKKLITR